MESESQRYKYVEFTVENIKISHRVFLSVILILNMKHFGYKCDKKEHWGKNSKFFMLMRKVTANKSLIVKMKVLA